MAAGTVAADQFADLLAKADVRRGYWDLCQEETAVLTTSVEVPLTGNLAVLSGYRQPRETCTWSLACTTSA